MRQKQTLSISQLEERKITICRRDALCLSIDGSQPFDGVIVRRAFPLTDPDRYWSLQEADGREIGIIAEPQALDPLTRDFLRQELDRQYFLPVIRHVLSVEDQQGSFKWNVETDCGRIEFKTGFLREASFQPVPSRYIITDSNGDRYDVRNIHALDKKSQFILMAHL